jgi:nicotinamidase-related amidase
VVGEQPSLVVGGVATDCCVISTVLAAADAGASVRVVTDACAGSTDDNHHEALHVMSLYAPLVSLTTTAELLAEA